MKRIFVVSLLFLVMWVPPAGEGAENPRSFAQRQQDAEEQKRMNARLEALEEALQAYQKEINSLRAEVRGLRQELSRTTDGGADVAALAEKIREVDRKRLDDQKLMLDALSRLQKEAVASTARPPSAASTADREEYEYEIRGGDNLSAIVRGLATEGFQISVGEVQKANPGVKWDRLQIGQKIIIPAPKR